MAQKNTEETLGLSKDFGDVVKNVWEVIILLVLIAINIEIWW